MIRIAQRPGGIAISMFAAATKSGGRLEMGVFGHLDTLGRGELYGFTGPGITDGPSGGFRKGSADRISSMTRLRR